MKSSLVGAVRSPVQPARERRLQATVTFNADGSSGLTFEPVNYRGQPAGSGQVRIPDLASSPARQFVRAFEANLSPEGRAELAKRVAELQKQNSPGTSSGIKRQLLVLDAATAAEYRTHAESRSTVKGARVGTASRTLIPLSNAGELEILFDLATGLPTNEKVLSAGRVRVQRTIQYAQVAGTALFARSRQITEFPHPSDPTSRMVVEETFTPTSVR